MLVSPPPDALNRCSPRHSMGGIRVAPMRGGWAAGSQAGHGDVLVQRLVALTINAIYNSKQIPDLSPNSWPRYHENAN